MQGNNQARVSIIPHATFAGRNALSSGAGYSLPWNFQCIDKTERDNFNLASSSGGQES